MSSFMGDYALNDRIFLGPDLRLLDKWGCLNQYKIHNDYQVWRLFTSLFLSTGFQTWGTNSVILLILGFMVENKKVSVIRMAIIYFSIGILTNFFTTMCEKPLSCGINGVLSGLAFALLAMVAINWKPLGSVANGMFRFFFIFTPIIFFIFVLMTSLTADADSEGYFKQQSVVAVGGGIIQGMCMGMMLMPFGPDRPSPAVGTIRKAGALILLVELIVIIPVFIWAIEPRKYY